MSKWLRFEDLERTYLIAEVGINHNGDVGFVKQMIDYAVVFGWDCIKLQKRNPDVSVPASQQGVLRETPWGVMPYLEYRRRMEFSSEQYRDIFRYAGDRISVTASVWDVDSVEFMKQFDVPFLKIPSAQITNGGLLEAACGWGGPLVLSTGMSTAEEVDRAVAFVRGKGVPFALLHTHSSYPAREEELNLRAIGTLRQKYGCVVGYSGHEFGLVTTTVTVALGARIIERHVTVSRTLWGTDQMASVEPQGMLKLAQQVRAVEVALGDGVKRVCPSELPARRRLRGA
jgi:N-acetylneuraminate synthase